MPTTPAQPGATEPAAPEMSTPATVPAEPSSTSSPSPQTSGVVTVWVPYEAKVTVNGTATRSVGSRRQFVSYGLKPGYSYKYEIRAQVVRDGKSLEDSRIVVLTAGQNTAVAFGLTANPTEGLAAK